MRAGHKGPLYEASTLASGTHLGPYEIIKPLGAGGMGEVYRARDSRLARDVAIKILPASLSSDPDRLRRFEQESRAASALNHPNILAVYDIGVHEGSPFLVTELLEGETSHERLRSGPLPLRKAIDIAIQAARGIAAAHEKGVVHRDLKPANLLLTTDGRVKILDFGLAKLTQPEQPGTLDSQARTRTLDAGTEAGVVLGTVGYMSPEQVRGKPADARSDIFALGTILYEMLSGQRAFERDSSADTMAAILKEDPPELSEKDRRIPPAVERVVRHCLEKNPSERFQSARDLAFNLEALSSLSTASVAALPATKPRAGKWPAALAGALVLLALGAAGGWIMSRNAEFNPLPKFHQLTFKRGAIYSARFAPDGQTVIYSASWDGQTAQLYSTRPDSPESRPLDLKDSNLFAISSSSELAISLGCKILFLADCGGTLARTPLSGGAPREIASNVNAADWTADGNQLAVVREVAGKFRVEFPLGKVLFESTGWLRSLRISPHGDAVAFVEHGSQGGDLGRVVVLDASGKRKTRSVDSPSVEGLAWSPRGDEVWYGATRDHAWSDEIHALSLSGKDRVILRLPGILRLHDVSRDGRLLLSKEMWRDGISFRGPGDKEERDLSWHDASLLTDLSQDGRNVAFFEAGEAAGTEFLTYMRGTDGSPAVKLGQGGYPTLSPDGKWVVTQVLSGSTDQKIMLLPTGVGQARSLNPYEIRISSLPGWMPDGNQVVFAGNDGHDWRIYVQDLNGGKPRPVTPAVLVEPERLGGTRVSPDGKFVVARDVEGRPWLYPLDGGSPRAVLGMERDDVWINWSNDGRSGFVRRWGDLPARVFRLDLSTGKEQLIFELAPGDPAGLLDIVSIKITPDGKSYAYTYERVLSELYIVEGVK